MAANRNNARQFEGKWEDLVRQPGPLAGQRVRVTVLSGDDSSQASLPNEIRTWLSEGEKLKFQPTATVKPDTFGDALLEKYRKQGLVL